MASDFDQQRRALAYIRAEAIEREAKAAAARGEPLVAAEKYLEVIVVTRTFHHQCRLYCWKEYELIVMNPFHLQALSPEHVATLESIANDKSDLAYVRASAYFVLGTFAWGQHQIDKSAKYNRSVLDVVEKCRTDERNGVVLSSEGNVSEWNLEVREFADDGVTEIRSTVGTYLQNLEESAKRCIELGETATSDGLLRGVLSHLVRSTDDSLVDRMGAGGGKCDCCGKKAEAMDGGELLQCSRCKMAYYCTAECQKRRWKAGHKQACRAPDQIEPGDVMLVTGIVSKPELNKKLVKIDRLAGNGRWIVNVVGNSPQTVSLASKNLVHIRPAK